MTALGLAFGLGLWHSLGAPERRGRRYFCRQLARLRHEQPGRVRRMVHHVEGLADGEVQMLVGRLRVTGAACESYDQGRPVAASTIECPLSEPGRLRHGLAAVALRRRAERLALELEGGTVALDGAVNVLVGSQQAHPRRRLHGLPRLLCERVYRDRPALIEPGVLLREPPVIRNLAGGETVLVLGRVVADGAGSEHEPAGAAPALPYRAAAPQRWLLRPAVAGEQAPVIEALYAGAPAIPMSRWTRFGFLPMTWVAGAVAVLAVAGSLSLRLAWQNDLRIVEQAGADTVALRHDRLPVHAPALALAAATPFHRAAAIDLLAAALASSEQRGRDIIETRVAAASLNQRCADAAEVLWQHRQPERAIAVAERCVAEAGPSTGDLDADAEVDAARHIAGLAWMDLGHYDRASDAFAGIEGLDRDPFWHTRRYAGELSEHAVAHVLAGAWTEAASILHHLAERSDATAGQVAAYACLAEAAAVRAGATESREQLVNLTRSFRSPACALLAADLAQGEVRRAWLHDPGIAWSGLGADSRGKQLLYLRELLLRESLGTDDAGAVAGSADTLRLLAAGVPGGATPYETLPALEAAVLERLYEDADPPRRDGVLRMAMAARAAGMAAHLGQHERAAYWRARVMADAETLTTHAAFAESGGSLWRSLYGDALLLAAVTYWRAGDLDRASLALERARGFALPALLSRVESVLALDARGELRASLAGVLTGRPADMDRGALQAGEQVLLDLARAGNGAALAELVADARVIPNAIGVLAPALASGHEALLELLHWGRRDPGARSVAEGLWYEGARAFAAERLGDHALAGRVREAAHRRHDALAQRQAAVLVFLIEHL